MKRALLAGLAFAAFAASAASATASELVTLSIPSSCIDPEQVPMSDPPPGKPARAPDLRVNVLLPVDYDGERPFPVLYLLHGLGGAYDYWLDDSDGELEKAVADLDAIVVMPEAGVVALYADSWNGGTREPCWQRYVDELIAEIENRFRVLPGRRWHAIGGFSSGALGAVLHAASKPGYFGQVLSFSGVVADIQRPEFELGVLELGVLALYAPTKIAEVGLTPWKDALGDPRAQEFYWAGHNPPKLAAALAHTRVYVAHGEPMAPTCIDLFRPRYRCAGPEVIGGIAEANLNRGFAEEFMAAARAAGADVTYRPRPGGHWYSYSSRFLADAIESWGLFEPVEEDPNAWTYKTVSRTGDMWGLRFTFEAPPEVVETFTREGELLRGEGSGTVTIETPAGASFMETLPFVRTLPW